MKFTLISARAQFDKVDPEMQKLGFNFAADKFGNLMVNEDGVEIEIESIEQLLKLRDDLGDELIIEPGNYIRIYNDYIE